jgi:tetratricopeptide (TPR) repeat protein
LRAVTAAALGLALGTQTPGAPTPAQRAVESAREAIERSPGDADPYNQLAMAFARRARETADGSKYDEAEAALEKSFELAPENFEGRKIRAWLMLGKHEFGPALELAKKLKDQVPDDPMVYGLLTDAHTELGNYTEAEEAAQWMLDLGRSSVPGLTRAAYLRELFGDIEGAIELMSSAYPRIDPVETEDRAWVLTQLAHLRLLTGNVNEAEALLDEALRLFPGYHYAQANLAKVRSCQGRSWEAVELLRERYGTAPHPENLFDLAIALERAGKLEEAKEAFRNFEKAARAEMSSWDNANGQLVSYYADHAGKPAEALEVASLEFERRRDIYTMDAYAWALHANGKNEEARKQIEAALAVGVKDPKLMFHAAAISAALGDRETATRGLQKTLETASCSEILSEARTLLETLR